MPTNAVDNATLAQNLVAYGASLVKLHIPYVWGGTTTKGFDCSGFVQFVYKHFGINLPRTSEEQAHVGTAVPRSALQPGDLLFYDIDHANSHVAMYAGNGQQIVARHTGTFLQFQAVGNFSHAQRIIGTVPGGVVGGISTTPANLQVGDPLGLANLIPTPSDVWGAIASSLGVPSLKDAAQRFGLILFGGILVLVGVHLLLKPANDKILNAINGATGSSTPNMTTSTTENTKRLVRMKQKQGPKPAKSVPDVTTKSVGKSSNEVIEDAAHT